MSQELVINPETGKPALAVTSYQDVEVEQLEAKVNEDQENVTRLKEAAEATRNQLNDFETKLASAEASLVESKSGVEAYNQLVASTGSDAGAEEPSVPAQEQAAPTEDSVPTTTADGASVEETQDEPEAPAEEPTTAEPAPAPEVPADQPNPEDF